MVEMDNNNTTISIFVDLSNAFDTINHKILLDKLKYYGIDGVAHNLIESYQTYRKQFIEIDSIKSDILTINTGVPEGSILGPSLFIIYINNISKASKLFKFIIYTDDTTLSITMEIVISEINNGNIEAMINRELAFINDWLTSNKLSLNINKCKYMIFHIP